MSTLHDGLKGIASIKQKLTSRQEQLRSIHRETILNQIMLRNKECIEGNKNVSL